MPSWILESIPPILARSSMYGFASCDGGHLKEKLQKFIRHYGSKERVFAPKEAIPSAN